MSFEKTLKNKVAYSSTKTESLVVYHYHFQKICSLQRLPLEDVRLIEKKTIPHTHYQNKSGINQYMATKKCA